MCRMGNNNNDCCHTTYSVRISAARRGVLGRLRWVLCVEWAIIITIAVIIYHLQCENFCCQGGSPWTSQVGPMCRMGNNNNDRCHHIPHTV